jgi:hypothetical protein
MRYITSLHITLLTTFAIGSQSFTPPYPGAGASSLSHVGRLAASANGVPAPPPVSKATFLAAVDWLNAELAKPENGGTGTAPISCAASDQSGAMTYAIGRTEAALPLSAAQGLGLVEAVYLVLVASVSPDLSDAGVQPRDAVVGIRVGGTSVADAGFHESTLLLDLAATAERFTAAVQYAEAHGVGEIVLELNRLVELRYTDDVEEQ